MLAAGARVLIIGGTRYIGRHTCLAALAAGAQVTLFNRGQSDDAWLAAYPQVRRIYGDRHDALALEALFAQDYDAVYDMIAYRPESVEPMLARHAGRMGQLIVCSTTSVYAPALYQPIDEDHPRGPHPAWGDYNMGKNAVEDLLATTPRVPTTVLRPQWVFGAYDYQRLATFYLARMAAGMPIRLSHPGVAQLNWTYAPDLARAFVAVTGLPAAAGQAYHVCCAETLTTLQFLGLCGQVLGTEPVVRVYRPEDLPGALRGQRIGPVRNLPLACSADRIRALCGFRTTPMAEALVRTVDWLRESGGLDAPERTPVEVYLDSAGA